MLNNRSLGLSVIAMPKQRMASSRLSFSNVRIKLRHGKFERARRSLITSDRAFAVVQLVLGAALVSRRPLFKYLNSPKQHYVDQGSRIASPNTEGQLPSPTPSASRTMNTELPSDCGNVSGSSRNILPALNEVTFCPHSLHYYSFTTMFQDDCDERGVSSTNLSGSLLALSV